MQPWHALCTEAVRKKAISPTPDTATARIWKAVSVFKRMYEPHKVHQDRYSSHQTGTPAAAAMTWPLLKGSDENGHPQTPQLPSQPPFDNTYLKPWHGPCSEVAMSGPLATYRRRQATHAGSGSPPLPVSAWPAHRNCSGLGSGPRFKSELDVSNYDEVPMGGMQQPAFILFCLCQLGLRTESVMTQIS